MATCMCFQMNVNTNWIFVRVDRQMYLWNVEYIIDLGIIEESAAESETIMRSKQPFLFSSDEGHSTAAERIVPSPKGDSGNVVKVK